ncbi:MAG: pentapeptide repeat-containing protein [Planctomycetes bacterium]|nr:pentapeptide repeat-containing protein [Planctomycetota bacterium]
MLAREGSPVIVRPRVFVKGRETLGTSLLEDVVRGWLDEGVRGAAYLCGPPGSGKSTALTSLRAAFDGDVRLVLRDEDGPTLTVKPLDLVLHATERTEEQVEGPVLTLAGWQLDDCIEYALAAHRDRCRSVMSRWHDAHLDFDGNPELCRIAIDLLAGDETLPNARVAAARHYDRLLGSGSVREEAIELCVRGALARSAADRRLVLQRLEARLGREARSLHYGAVASALAAERIASRIESGSIDPAELFNLRREFSQRLARELTGRRRAWVRLWQWCQRFEPRERAIFAELCHALQPAAFARRLVRTATTGRKFVVTGAQFHDAPWAGANFSMLELVACDLTRADLSRVRCTHLAARRACLLDAKLVESEFNRLSLSEADLQGADLSRIVASESDLQKARLVRARLDHASLCGANLTEVDATDASFVHADLSGACFVGAVVSGADFRDARLDGAAFPRLDLRSCRFDGVHAHRADFARSRLDGADLTGTELRKAWLAESILTGAKLAHANLAEASLIRALLADLHAPGANLKGADLSIAIFHMGSTRSGLVFGAPMEGSRTGFYDRETVELAYKRPEELRVANLVGADLRGVKFERTDFYLVDLRGARLDPELYEHAKRCGAILGPA